MGQAELLKHLGINALFWTGALAIVLSLLEGSAYFVLFFIGLVVLNYLIALAIGRQVEPVEKQLMSGGQLGFNLKPITYPKVLDEESRDYVPEFIHVNIKRGNSTVFNGNLARDTLKKLRDTLDAALKAKVTTENATAAKRAKKRS